LLGDPSRDLLADDAVEEDVGRVAEDLRPDDGATHARDGQDEDEDDLRQLRSEVAYEPHERGAQVSRLLGR
jgi:hypothetical protein